jgi:hypothetical protein
MLIRILIKVLLLIEVMRICDHGSRDPSRLHFEPPRHYCESVYRPPWLHGSILSLHATILSLYMLLNNPDLDPQPWTCMV